MTDAATAAAPAESPQIVARTAGFLRLVWPIYWGKEVVPRGRIELPTP